MAPVPTAPPQPTPTTKPVDRSVDVDKSHQIHGQGRQKMQKIHIAYDIDGTLRANREERHRTEIEANPRIVELLKANANSKNVVTHLWSNRGADYCRVIREHLGLERFVKPNNCHQKVWLRDWKPGEFWPDIAYDDQQRFDGADKVIVVREK